MPRKRLRPDYSMIVYKFWAKPIGPIPQAMWAKAKAMRDLWNDLTAAREKSYQDAKDSDKEAKKEVWVKFQNESRLIIGKSGLDWESQSEIADRFQAASKRAVKYKQTLHQSHILKKVMIAHRFTQGGMPVDKIFTTHSRAWRIKIDPVDPSAYLSSRRDFVRDRWTKGEFGIDHQNIINFETIIHRQIPTSIDGKPVFIKKILWCGTFDYNLHPQNRWQWSIQVVCECPPVEVNREDSIACGLDLGWRIMAEGSYIRIGMIVDSAGRTTELRLPLSETGTRSTRRSLVYSQYQDFRGILKLDSQIDRALNDCKTRLKETVEEPPKGLNLMRQGGLRKLLRDLRENSNSATAIDRLEKWEEQDSRLRLIKANVQNRLIGRKLWLYQNLASWLTNTYRVIVWEGDLDLKEMAEQENKPPVLSAAAKYRQWAAISILRQCIKNATRKNGAVLLDGEMAYSTTTCWECGEPIIEGGGKKLFTVCPNSHRHDQDVQAAKNLLSQAPEILEQTKALRNFVADETKKAIDIPENLIRVTVPCS